MRSGIRRSSAGGGHATALVLAHAFTTALVVALVLFAAACSLETGGEETSASDQARVLELARPQLARAAAALRARDPGAFAAALPAAADAVSLRERLAAIYGALSPLPWASFGFTVEPIRGRRGVYRVVGSGRLGDAGPSDRLAVVRYLRLAAGPDRVTVTEDVTPENLRRRYLMALHDPVVLQRRGFIVLADRWARDRARTVIASAGRARTRLETLGLDTSPTVLLTIYGSAEDVRDALAVRLPSVRLRFFAHAPLRVAGEEALVSDVGVMGPWLRDPGQSVDGVFVHELAHAYTVAWFAGDPRPPALLAEGIAAAAEGIPVSRGLREEVASGDSLWPLPESFGVEDVWDGGDMEAIGLGYEVGRSLVDYVDLRWGPERLEEFVRAVAASEPTEAGMDTALPGALGVSWDEFYAGWRRFVLHGD